MNDRPSKLPGRAENKGARDAQSRELKDPEERMRPLPWFIVMLIGAMTMWGVFYIHDMHTGLASPYGDSRTASALAPRKPEGAGGQPVAAPSVDGSKIYASRCTPCHQAGGIGIPGVFPPLAGSEWVTGSDKTLVLIPLHGIEGPISVRGATYNGAMPSFSTLPDAEIAAVLTYARAQWGNQAAPVSEATVKAARDATKAQTTPWPSGEAIRAQAGN